MIYSRVVLVSPKRVIPGFEEAKNESYKDIDVCKYTKYINRSTSDMISWEGMPWVWY